MSYTPNASQLTEPVESRAVQTAALEFRMIKSKLTRTLRFPASDTAGSQAELPAANARAGRLLVFDPVTGQPVAGPLTHELASVAVSVMLNAATEAATSATASQTAAANSATAAAGSATSAATSAAAAATSAAVIDTANFVQVIGNQTIGGVKAFSSPPVVPPDSFSFAQLQNIPTAAILGRSSAGTGDVETLTGAQVASTMTNAIGQLAGMRNKIINGKMEIAQRGTTVSLTASGQFSLDRWVHAWDGSGATRAVFRQAFPPGTGPEGIPFFLSYAQSVAGSGGTFVNFEQRIEGVDTLAGQQVTLSLCARNNAGTPLPSIRAVQFFGTGGSATVTTVVASNVATTGTFARYTYTFTVPSIVGKTVAGSNDYLAVSILLPINSVYTFDITGVQLEVGTVATPFEHRPIGAELALCQRYYETGSAFGQSAAASDFGSTIPYKATKRASPTLAFSSITYVGASTLASTTGLIADSTAQFAWNATASAIAGFVTFNWTSASEL